MVNYDKRQRHKAGHRSRVEAARLAEAQRRRRRRLILGGIAVVAIVGVFLGEPGPYNQPPERQKLVLSLEALRSIDPAEPVQRFVNSIIEARGDFNGKVLSLRHDDLKALCVLVGGDIPTGVAQLRAWGVLLEGPVVDVPEDPFVPSDPDLVPPD